MSVQRNDDSSGVLFGASIGGCAVMVVTIAVIIYCYVKRRKEKAVNNNAKSTDVFATAASNTQTNVPVRPRVNRYPDPEAPKPTPRSVRFNPQNTTYDKDGSEGSSDLEGRHISQPRDGGQWNEALSSTSSCDESSSCGDEKVPGSYNKRSRSTSRERRPRSGNTGENNDKDTKGRMERRPRSSDRTDRSEKLRSSGRERGPRSESTGSSRGSQRSRRSTESYYKRLNHAQATIEIFR